MTVLSWVSQVPSPSQSSKPAAHVVARQVPVQHDSLEFGTSHTAPQVWQFARLVSDVSQPFFGSMSQSPHSGPLQAKVQPVVALQLAVPCAFVHVSPQLRQFEGVPFVVSQPA